MKKNSIFITTSIPYANAPPHIGFGLEAVLTDAYARFLRFKGSGVFWSTGTDEHGLKIAIKSEEQKISPKEFTDKISKKFKDLKDVLNLSYDTYVRTTSSEHIKTAQKLWRMCKKDIYKKKYKGLYCVGCEAFYREGEFDNNICPVHKKPLIPIEEENYFFNLKKYSSRIEELLTKDIIHVYPEHKKKEVLNFIKEGLEDFSISRPRDRVKNWGIPVPGDPSQLMYVWFDALTNYLTAVKFRDNGKLFKRYWLSADEIIHIIGKDIIKFHLIYWPAMLLSAKLPVPSKVFVHGFITIDKEKISKSLGNVIYPDELVNKYGVDAVRYYFLREIPSFNDGDFSIARFEQIYSSELVNELGNLVMRLTTMASRENIELEFNLNIKQLPKKYMELSEKMELHNVMSLIIEKTKSLNKKIDESAPWKVKGSKKRIVLIGLLKELREIGLMLQPYLPGTSEKILKYTQGKISKEKALFPRLNFKKT